MNPRVKRKLDELLEALSGSEEYQKLKEAQEEIEKHEAARLMLRDLQTKQEQLQQVISSGEKPSEELINEYQKTMELIGFNPYIRQLIQAQAEFVQMMVEIQSQIEQAVGISQPEDQAEPNNQPEEPRQKSKLWTPGSNL